MNEKQNHTASEEQRSTTLQEFLAIGFRRRRLIAVTFVGIVLAGLLVAFLLPTKYESEMKILVRRERADSLVSPTRDAAYEVRTYVTESELESEAELLKSWDLLTQVVVECGLHKSTASSFWESPWKVFFGDDPDKDEKRVGRAAMQLAKKLKVAPIRRTNLISVSYQGSDPELVAKVLNTLATRYLDKHLALRRVPGAFEFFNTQAQEYRKTLERLELRLADFTREEGVVAPGLEKEIKVRRLADFEAESRETRAAVAATRQRIRALEQQLESLPNRQTTQVRVSDNPQLLQSLKASLLELELRRTQLLAKFDPGYRLVKDVEDQIAQTRQAITAAEQAPLREEITDRDPAYESVRIELARAQAELASQEAHSFAMAGVARAYRAETQSLERKEILYQDLMRAARAQEENYLLYLRKQEEARISDALDRQRISNAVVAEAATVPVEPKSRMPLILAASVVFGCVASTMLAFVVDYWDPSFRTPEDVRSFLGTPVVAAFPKGGQP